MAASPPSTVGELIVQLVGGACERPLHLAASPAQALPECLEAVRALQPADAVAQGAKALLELGWQLAGSATVVAAASEAQRVRLRALDHIWSAFSSDPRAVGFAAARAYSKVLRAHCTHELAATRGHEQDELHLQKQQARGHAGQRDRWCIAPHSLVARPGPQHLQLPAPQLRAVLLRVAAARGASDSAADLLSPCGTDEMCTFVDVGACRNSLAAALEGGGGGSRRSGAAAIAFDARVHLSRHWIGVAADTRSACLEALPRREGLATLQLQEGGGWGWARVAAHFGLQRVRALRVDGGMGAGAIDFALAAIAVEPTPRQLLYAFSEVAGLPDDGTLGLLLASAVQRGYTCVVAVAPGPNANTLVCELSSAASHATTSVLQVNI
eukprot:g2927.t1